MTIKIIEPPSEVMDDVSVWESWLERVRGDPELDDDMRTDALLYAEQVIETKREVEGG